MGRSVFAVAAMLVGAMCLAAGGCGHTRADGGPVRVRVWTMWTGGEERDFERVVAAYNRTHPGVTVENVGAVDDPKTIRAIVAGDPPDLCTLASAYSLGTMAANGALEPLQTRFDRSGLTRAEYTPGALEQGTYNGTLYALPYLQDCIALLYNKDVFRAAGLNPNEPPATTQQLLADCRRITEHDQRGRLTRIGLRPVDPACLIAEFGGKFVAPANGRITADDPRNVRAIRFYKSLMEAQGGYESVNAFGAGFGADMGAFNPFFLGQIGMMYSGEWNPYWAYKYAPSLHYGVAPLPYPASDPSLRGTVFLGSNLLCIPSGAKHAQQAWDFLVWTQSPVAQTMLASTLHNVPNIRAVDHAHSLTAGAPWRPYFGRFMQLADSRNAGYFPTLPIASMYVDQLDNAVDSVCYGTQSAQAALRAVTERVQRQKDQYAQ